MCSLPSARRTSKPETTLGINKLLVSFGSGIRPYSDIGGRADFGTGTPAAVIRLLGLKRANITVPCKNATIALPPGVRVKSKA